jgi:diacylglycerol kinase family enzyme
MQAKENLAKDYTIIEVTTARWLFVSNLPNYAGQLGITSDATPTDGLLDWCAFQGGSFFSSLRYLFSVLLRSHPKLRDCQLGRCEGVCLTAEGSTSTPIPYQIDGDPGGFLPVEIKVLPGRFRAIVDRQWSSNKIRL